MEDPFKIGLSLFNFKQVLVDSGTIVSVVGAGVIKAKKSFYSLNMRCVPYIATPAPFCLYEHRCGCMCRFRVFERQHIVDG